MEWIKPLIVLLLIIVLLEIKELQYSQMTTDYKNLLKEHLELMENLKGKE